MNAYEKIRAALELADREYNDRWTYAEMNARDELMTTALAALAELEKSTAPVAEIREPTREMVKRVAADFYGSEYTGADSVRNVLKLWQRELGPALGLVELKEPTPEECERMARGFYGRPIPATECAAGSAMFDSVRAVLWPKEG